MTDKEIFEKYPDLNIGIVIVKEIDNSGQSDEIINLISEKEYLAYLLFTLA